jgi:hypothetical protein
MSGPDKPESHGRVPSGHPLRKHELSLPVANSPVSVFLFPDYTPGVWPGMAIGYWPLASGMTGGFESQV